jgi:hypothetical protein
MGLLRVPAVLLSGEDSAERFQAFTSRFLGTAPESMDEYVSMKASAWFS